MFRLPRFLQASRRTCSLFMAVIVCLPAAGDWAADPQNSYISFVTTKNDLILEAHRFKDFSASIDSSGAAELVIDLSSLDTLIPIRDQRMLSMLFEVLNFPQARFNANVDLSKISELPAGSSVIQNIQGTLSLHGFTQGLTGEVIITKTSADSYLVSSTKPLIVTAGAFDLAEGIEKLRKVAGLNSITPSVAVSFTLNFLSIVTE